MNNRLKGKEKEQLAEDYLRRHGCRILEKNFQVRTGEIDLIIRDGDELAFVEVKYRSSPRAGYPGEAVDLRKQQKIIRTAMLYCRMHRLPEQIRCRFDVVAILGQQIEWIKNAFMIE